MAYRCANCDKGIMIGRTHKHHPGVAGAQWKKRAQSVKKTFKPNLHWARVQIAGNLKRVRLCTKCLRIAKEQMKPVVAQTPSSQV